MKTTKVIFEEVEKMRNSIFEPNEHKQEIVNDFMEFIDVKWFSEVEIRKALNTQYISDYGQEVILKKLGLKEDG